MTTPSVRCETVEWFPKIGWHKHRRYFSSHHEAEKWVHRNKRRKDIKEIVVCVPDGGKPWLESRYTYKCRFQSPSERVMARAWREIQAEQTSKAVCR